MEAKGNAETVAPQPDLEPIVGSETKPPAVKDDWTTVRLQAPARTQLEKFRGELMKDDSWLPQDLRDIVQGGRIPYSLGDVAYVAFIIARRAYVAVPTE